MTSEPDTGAARRPFSSAERALAERGDRYRSLFAYSPHGVFSLDLDGRYTDANEAMQQLTGYSREELLAIDYHRVIHPEDIQASETAFAAVVDRVPQLLEARLMCAAGDVREVKITAVPVVVSDQVVGVHCLTEDITEANDMHRDLEAANTAKTLFLANVSHEVRTPLTMVLGASEILMDTDLDPAQAQLADMVERNSQRLLRLVDDILDFSRLEAGKVSLHPAPFRITDVVEELLEWARPLAAASGLQLRTTVDAALPTSLQGDAVRVSQILSNLLDNALKYTESGTVGLTVTRGASATDAPDDGPVRVEFTVTDTGVGVSPEHLDLLFDSFTQADPSATRSRNGVGLGLAICRDLVDLMGGDLGAVSTPGTGSTFTAVLPLHTSPEAAPQPPPT